MTSPPTARGPTSTFLLQNCVSGRLLVRHISSYASLQSYSCLRLVSLGMAWYSSSAIQHTLVDALAAFKPAGSASRSYNQRRRTSTVRRRGWGADLYVLPASSNQSNILWAPRTCDNRTSSSPKARLAHIAISDATYVRSISSTKCNRFRLGTPISTKHSSAHTRDL